VPRLASSPRLAYPGPVPVIDMNRYRLTIALAVACALALQPVASWALDRWTEPYPGIRSLERTTPGPASFRVLVLDLTRGVRMRATPAGDRWRTTSDYAHSAGLAIAVNGGPWDAFTQKAKGLAAGGGEIWSRADGRHAAFGVTRGGRAIILPAAEAGSPPADLTDAVSGQPLLVTGGGRAAELAGFPAWRDARTAIGVSRDGRRVIVATVDGRSNGAQGATLGEMADLMIEHGAERALNLDGGSSTSLFIANRGGLVNRPSRGWEREVVNHIGAVAAEPAATALPAEVRETPARAQAAARTASPPPRSLRRSLSGLWLFDWVFLGVSREWILPAVFIALTFGGPAGVVLIVVRLSRRGVRRPAGSFDPA
jgi:hypothetical protein